MSFVFKIEGVNRSIKPVRIKRTPGPTPLTNSPGMGEKGDGKGEGGEVGRMVKGEWGRRKVEGGRRNGQGGLSATIVFIR